MSDQVETPQPETPAPSLSIQDLVAVCKIMQIASQRGAIQVSEMSQVGPVYDRIVAFLEANGAVQRPAPAAEETAQ
jgi:hypothetical protein